MYYVKDDFGDTWSRVESLEQARSDLHDFVMGAYARDVDGTTWTIWDEENKVRVYEVTVNIDEKEIGS